MKPNPSLEDIIGIEYSKLGFFREAQEKIAQLRASTEELERRQQEMQAILDAISDVMLVIDLQYKILSVNNVYYSVFDEPFPVGKLCFEVLRKRSTPCSPCPALNAINANLVQRQEDIIDMHECSKFFEITASPIRDSSGNPSSVLLVKKDVTSKREYQRKSYEAEKMATIGLLASGVAHEINNPLTAIYGFSQGLKRRLDNNKKILSEDFLKEMEFTLNIILEECKRCQDIIQNLLTYSRELPTTMTTVDLNSLIYSALKLIRHRLGTEGSSRLNIHLDPSIGTIDGNPQRLTQLILNLIMNAIDATIEKGNIKISTNLCPVSDALELVVEDNGCGIPEEYLPKIFDPFFTTKPVGSGTGMGLAICYNIAQQHGATIQVQSLEGKGSRFTVTFPKKAKE